jgi:hypothetical protein
MPPFSDAALTAFAALPPLKKPVADSWAEAVELGIDYFRDRENVCPACKVGGTFRTIDLTCCWCEMQKVFEKHAEAHRASSLPWRKRRNADRPHPARGPE